MAMVESNPAQPTSNLDPKLAYPARILMASTFATLVLSMPLIAIGIWLAIPKHNVTCFMFIEIPITVIGITLFVASVVGMMGAQRRERLMLWVYMVLVFGMILFLAAIVIFTVFVTRGGPSYSVSNATFKEYRLGGYSLWFQEQVKDPRKWGSMIQCLQQEQHVCDGLNRAYRSRASFFKAHLTPPQSGCCKPPVACGSTFVHATEWVNMTHALATSDCGRWDPEVLCYQCASCRAGLLERVKQAWRFVAIVSFVVLICLIITYTIGWLAFLKGLWDDSFQNKIEIAISNFF